MEPTYVGLTAALRRYAKELKTKVGKKRKYETTVVDPKKKETVTLYR
jgi:hypothetical protein